MKTLIRLVALSALGLLVNSIVVAQTPVYVRASGPQVQIVTGCTNATPVVCQTQFAHNFSSSCNTTTNVCYCDVQIAMGTGATKANGVRECVPTDTTHLAIYDTTGAAIAGDGDWWYGYVPNANAQGGQNAQWIAPVTPFTQPSGPVGYFNGTNGDTTRSIELTPQNGINSTNGVVVSGCPGACVVTVNVSYNPSTFGRIPVAAGQHFSVTGTTTNQTLLDSCGDGTETAGPQSPYTVASVTSSSYSSNSFTCASLTNGDYTNTNATCGHPSTPNDTIGGTLSCTTISFIGQTANPAWNRMLYWQNFYGTLTSPSYKFKFDGGGLAVGDGTLSNHAMAVLRFMVDHTPTTGAFWLTQMLYAANNDFRSGGVGYAINSNHWTDQSDSAFSYSTDAGGLALIYTELAHSVEGSYWTGSEQTAFKNRTFNDLNDPTVTACTTANQDLAGSGHKWLVSSGVVTATGVNDGTHFQLPNTDAHYSTANYYNNLVAYLGNTTGAADDGGVTWGLITGQTNTGGVAVSGGWQGAGVSPVINGLSSATYTSGLTVTGTTGQTVCLSFGSGATGTVSLTGTNTIAGGTGIGITFIGNATPGQLGIFLSAPTSATVVGSCGTASATGTATVSSTLFSSMGQIASATYTSGLTITGTTGQYICLSFGSNGYGIMQLTGLNAIASGTPIQITNYGQFGSAPTTASVLSSCSTATATGTATVSAVMGTSYRIYDTVTLSSTTGGATATLTWTKTASLSGTLNVGDEVFGINVYGGGNEVGQTGSYVTAVGSNSATVINGNYITGSATVPSVAWRLIQQQPTDCGRNWATKWQDHNTGFGEQATLYGPASGAYQGGNAGQLFMSISALNGQGTSPMTWMALDLAMAGDDARAVRDLARQSVYYFDQGIRAHLDYSTGRIWDGPAYSLDNDIPSITQFLWLMNQNLIGYPSIDNTGPWVSALAKWSMFSTLPVFSGGWSARIGWAGSGGVGAGAIYPGADVTYGLVFDPRFYFQPADLTTKQYRNWQDNYFPGGTMWGQTEPAFAAQTALFLNPNIGSSTYSAQPLQYCFVPSSSALVPSLTGWTSYYGGGQACISRTCWTGAGCTVALFDGAVYAGANTYDWPRAGNISVFKGSCLLGADASACNNAEGNDPSTLSDTLQIGGPSSGQFQDGIIPTIGKTPIMEYTQAGAGSYGAQYGDASSRWSGACVNELNNYNPAYLGVTIDHAIRCFLHQKASGHDEFIWQDDDAVLSSGSAMMNWHLQYPQNGQTQGLYGGQATGSTTALTSTTIKELEVGTTGLTYGLLTSVFSPNTLTVNDDCVGHGGGQCAPGDTYPGGGGNTHRFTVAAGASTSAVVTKLQTVVCHKLMQSLSDTTFTTSALNPDANWTGAACTGANSTGVSLYALGGMTRSSMTPVTPSFSGPADWNLTGLTAGTYTVTVGGTPVTGSPFTVVAGDNSIQFSTTGSGTLAFSASGVGVSIAIGGSVGIGGGIIIH